MALFCTGLFLVGDQLVALLYGDAYVGYLYVIVLLALTAGVSSLSSALGSGLRAIERPDVIFKLRMVGLAVTTVSTPLLIGPWGILGAAWGLLAGTLTVLGVKWIIFCRLVGNPLTGRHSADDGIREPSRPPVHSAELRRT